MTQSVDVAIIGAGPAGSAAAITLSQAGLSVAVYDKATFPRDKCCGDGLTTGALHRLQSLGLDPNDVASFHRVDELALRSSGGQLARIGLGFGSGCYAAVARRADLDAALVELARNSGAAVNEGVAVNEVREHRSGVDVGFSDGRRIEARTVIAADGAWSPTRQQLFGESHDANTPRWFAFRAYVEGVTPHDLNAMWIWFEKSFLPGYAWCFPLGNGQANVGLFVEHDRDGRGGALAQSWRSVLDSAFLSSLLGPNARLSAAPRAWPIPTAIAPAQLTSPNGRVLFIGDAAGMADPFSGEGIGQALESAAAAAQAIYGHGSDPMAMARQYRRSIATGLAREHQLSRLSSRLVSSPILERAIIASIASSPRLGRAIGTWLFEAYPRTIAIQPSLWRRDVIGADGAYAAAAEVTS